MFVDSVQNHQRTSCYHFATRGGNIEAVYKTLVAAGITFLPDNDEGVGVRGKEA